MTYQFTPADSEHAEDTGSSWETPDRIPAPSGRGTRAELLGAALSLPGIITFFRHNGLRIALASLILFAVGIGVLTVLPLRYAATALVVVDPREQHVTNEQNVLPGIGQDAAALQSLIEIAKSDEFLRPLIAQLDIGNDRDVAGSETDPARILVRFANRLDISRRGLTYVVAITFTSNSPERAARYANAIAEAIVAGQAQDRTTATDDAADWLSDRLKTMSDRLRVSEDAVAEFKRDHRIVIAGRDGTTQQLRITDLSQQSSAARLRVEDAKTRYEQAQRDLKANVEGPLKQDLLATLRSQRVTLNDHIAQKRAVLGDRHPDLVVALGQLAELNRQIESERKRRIDSAKSEYDTLQDQQKTLERQLRAAEAEALTDAQAQVELQGLQRSADANRNIYEQFLARFKTTNEQRQLQSSQTKIASPASPPVRPTRPPLALLLVALAVASTMTSTAAVAALQARTRLPRQEPAKPLPAEPVQASTPPLAPPDPPVWARIPIPAPRDGRMTVWQTPIGGPADADLRPYLQPLLELIAAVPEQRGKVVLVTSLRPDAGAGAIARALNLSAVDDGLMSVLIQVQNDGGPGRRAGVTARNTAPSDVRASRTTLGAVQLLLGGGRDIGPGAEDIRTEFALIVVDAPSLAERPEVASLAADADLIVLVEREPVADLSVIRDAVAALAAQTSAAIGVVINQAAARAIPSLAIAS